MKKYAFDVNVDGQYETYELMSQLLELKGE